MPSDSPKSAAVSRAAWPTGFREAEAVALVSVPRICFRSWLFRHVRCNPSRESLCRAVPRVHGAAPGRGDRWKTVRRAGVLDGRVSTLLGFSAPDHSLRGDPRTLLAGL